MGRRYTVGFLVSYLTEDYAAEIWRGLVKAAEKRGVDLLAIDGGAIEDPYAIHRQKATIYSVIQNVTFDCMILAAGSIGNFATDARMEEFLQSLPRVPQVLIGKAVGDRYTVLVDNRSAMRQAVSHLIEEHGRTRIAFIAGTPTNREAVERMEGYREALESHDIPFDPSLVHHGDFNRIHGKLTAQDILSGQIPRPDAIAASTDYNAISAIEELQRNGISVPHEIAVTGFDDIRDCVSCHPAVTTIRQPYEEIGEVAIDLALEAVEGEEQRRIVTLPARMMPRTSCGCKVPQAIAEAKEEEPELLSRLEGVVEECISSGSKEPLLNELEALLKEDTGLFPSFGQCFDVLKGLFESMEESCEGDDVRREMLRSLYAFTLEYLGRTIEELQKANTVRIRDTYIILNQFYEQSSFTFDPAAFSGDLDDTLPRIGITFFLLCLYQTIQERVRVEHMFSASPLSGLERGTVGSPGQIIDSFLSFCKKGGEGGSLILLPLWHRNEDLGFVLCRGKIPDGALYESLVSQLSNAIKGTALVNEVRSHTEQLERKVEQRSGELKAALDELEVANKRLEAISVLDELTGLYNRRGFLAFSRQHFDLARRREGDFLIFFVDMDGLKDINDSFGHASGDEALCDMAWLLTKVFRQTDIIARMGGDEFVALAIDMTPDQEHVVRERLREIVGEFNATSGKPFKLAYSMGCAAWKPTLYGSLEEMMAEADRRLYEEKRHKKLVG
jgi:diguanylate cyclase (GGDEF)-like protein